MSRLLFAAVLASLVAASMAAPFVQVSLTFDNKASHAINNDRAVLEELARELCFTDKSKVASVRMFDETRTLDTQSRGVYACFPGKYSVERILEFCNKKRYQSEFEDELEDRTSPDLDVEKFQCTICDTNSLTANGPCYAKTSPTLRAEKPIANRIG